ncbi:helix-turn-helix domain-containing protein [Psychroserpens ponticola]|uniref:Helix-turn-helix domain-containing protein n=1 Tax=Psychroserpens ponticola TaxID=2932268 RepID=A0ABY7S1E3_9FLAO|nr:helix-turn-helix domain-containing protein [Psychroserpens ponticola]WCO03147.1 helix-turn-helix domain-containing protein [Psychroserpens ponticola]
MINQKSIAILPFVNHSNTIDNEYFCDGITEEIINALTKVKGLKVTARTSSFAFKNTTKDVRHIGNQLGVATVLEGSIKIFRNKIRINVQLIRTSDGFHTWTQKFDRDLEDLFALQDEISLIIAEQIRENFGHLDISDHISVIGTKSIDAYKLYLKGRSYQLNWDLDDYITAIDCYKQSIAIDHNFYDAYFSLSRSYGILASWGYIDKLEGEQYASTYLAQGMRINPTSYLGYFSTSSIIFWNHWDYANGIVNFRKTLNINPSFAIAYEGISEIYMATGELEKAMLTINLALDISPLSPNHHFTKGNIYFLKKDYANAIIYLDECLKIDPNFTLAIETKLACFMLMNDAIKYGNYVATMPQLISPKVCEVLFNLMHTKTIYTSQDIKALALDVDASFKSIYPWHFYALIYCGQIDKALHIFEEKVALKIGQLVNFRLDPFLEPLRSFASYQSIEQALFSNYQIGTVEEPIIDVKLATQPIPNTEIDVYIKLLKRTIQKDKLYLSSGFSLKDLSASINLHPNKLSWLLNEHLSLNFNEFINRYRLEHFKLEVLKPENSHYTLLGIAFESGFNSKTVFNTFFKKETGLTPRQWVKLQS